MDVDEGNLIIVVMGVILIVVMGVERYILTSSSHALPNFFFFFFFFFPCSADHERDWPPCKVVFFRVGNQYAEYETQQLNDVQIFL